MNTPLTCAAGPTTAPSALGGDLNAGQQAAIDAHLATCAACRSELALWRMLPNALAALEGDHALGRSTSESWARLEPHLAATAPDHSAQPESSGPAIALADAPHSPIAPRPDAYLPRSSKANTLSALLAVVLIVAVSGTLFSYLRGTLAATPGGSSNSATPIQLTFHPTHLLTVPELLPNTLFYDVQMLSPDDGWAVGGTPVTIGNVGTCNTAIYHYQHGRWSASPDVVASSMLFSVSMVAPDNGWAVGETTHEGSINIDETALMLHYDGHHWRSVVIPPHDQLNKVTMLSATEGWALVNDANTYFHVLPVPSLSERVWSNVDPQQPAFYVALAMTAPNQGWAVGYQGTIGRYLDGVWTDWPATASGDLTALAMRSATDGWAIAGSPENHTAKPYQQLTALHWDGAAWRSTPLASAALHPIITSIAFSGPTGILAGKIENDEGTTQGSVLFQYANGRWNLDSFQIDAAIAAVSLTFPTEGWAVGYRSRMNSLPNGSSETTFDGVLLHFLNGHWTVYQP